MTKGHATLMGPAFHAWWTHTRKVHKAKALAKANASKHLQRWVSFPACLIPYAAGLAVLAQEAWSCTLTAVMPDFAQACSGPVGEGC